MGNNTIWNSFEDPIATRLRDNNELKIIQNNKTMLYHEPTKTTALVMDVWIVDPVPNCEETNLEDRYIRYTTEDHVKEDFAVDLDEEGWLWFDELTQEEL